MIFSQTATVEELRKELKSTINVDLLSDDMLLEIRDDPDKVELYQLEGKPKLRLAFPIALQHLLIMFTSNLTPILIIAAAAGATTSQTILMVQCAMLMAGLTSFINLYPIKLGKNFQIGANLPIVMGTSSTFLAPGSLVAATAVAMGYSNPIGVVVGAMIIGSFFEATVGLFYKQLKVAFPPLVIGSILLSLGFMLVNIGVGNLAGGRGTENYGSVENLAIGFGVFFLNVFLQRFGKGMWKSASILIAVVAGYIAAFALGMIDLYGVADAAWISFPIPFALQPQFEWWAISSMIIVFIISGLSTIGYTNSITSGAIGREASVNEVKGAIYADAFSSFIAGCMNSLPNTEFGQNAGTVIMTKIVSKWIIVITACMLIFTGLFPKAGAIFAATPAAVLGGAVLSVFAMILTNGMMMIAQAGFTPRNLTVVCIILGVGIGFGFAPDISAITANMPSWLQFIFRDRIALISIVGIFTNLLFPRDKEESAN